MQKLRLPCTDQLNGLLARGVLSFLGRSEVILFRDSFDGTFLSVSENARRTTMTISSLSLAETLFVQGMCFVTLAPRLPQNSNLCGGGTVSNGFRKLFLALALMNLSRIVVFTDFRFNDRDGEVSWREEVKTWIYFGMTALESFGLSFMCLLTPYLLQCQLTDRINIRPGRDLLPWMYGILGLNIMGVSLTSIYHKTAFWSIKRLGDALSVPPVLFTLRTYDAVVGFAQQQQQNLRSTPTGPGKGCILSQVLQAVEKINLGATLLAVIGYLLAHNTLGQQATHNYIAKTQQESMSAAFRLVGVYCNWVRLVFHGLLLNTIEEQQEHQYVPVSVPTEKEGDTSVVELHATRTTPPPSTDAAGTALVNNSALVYRNQGNRSTNIA